jgi:hypothetical protein
MNSELTGVERGATHLEVEFQSYLKRKKQIIHHISLKQTGMMSCTSLFWTPKPFL